MKTEELRALQRALDLSHFYHSALLPHHTCQVFVKMNTLYRDHTNDFTV